MKTVSVFIITLLVTTLSFVASAQQPTVSKNEARAYEKGTRNYDGTPGANYWQNSSDYFIQATVDVKNKVLSGREQIVYSNNSPDSLKTIVIRLYQDVFKNGVNRNSIVPVDPADIHDGVRIASLKVNNESMDVSESSQQVVRDGTLMYVILPKKLAPHNKTELQIEWSFDFPQHTLIRMGTIDSTSMFVGQWYPQIAVYDDVNRWDTRSYNGLAEFYNDFCNFEVDITVPDQFMVWATGDPQNLKDVLQTPVYSRYTKACTSDEIHHVITEEDILNKKITTQNHTWKYKASNVSDFAFGVSDHYLWDVTSVVVDKNSDRRTVVGTAYNKEAVNFDQVVQIARETVRSLSEEMPGIPYPFPYLTVYAGDFGMEYPMITNVGPDADFGMTVYANSHEITHAYFPFLVGTNETVCGWMDEGLTVFIPENSQHNIAPELNIGAYNTSAFSHYAGIQDEVALITPTHYLDPGIYFYLNYAKGEQALRMLEMELGPELFKTCLLTFIERWKYKHPTALDFFNTFSDVSKRDLNWYWMAWYYQVGGIPDLAIESVTKTGNRYVVIVENKGQLPLPVALTFYANDNVVGTSTEAAGKWQKNTKQIELIFDTKEPVSKITLGSETIPDAHPEDNEYLMK
ncbi:MAG: hypothetical protein A2W93_01670 [Bacteroidetes bacterium GWF2_43_63]|nr:MAG: hypothetical protein A2W94_10405 [Bacteroidetes bacterium GWE2_42_42]OFY55776.1 MAG: hypothetical protein A2W93_01670 [Bacteroidetes bacterium GWF2_43_63]HBG71308.1 hypothetical protein [Bacteroidales bacterium]HCB60471.1 hypothetical protein [Bacteroidales bacterium]HCY22572.1 hypothetical protein [Bacteroidales bacterium]